MNTNDQNSVKSTSTPAASPQYPYYPDDEISLIDLAKILIRRKIWFFLTWLVVVLASVAYVVVSSSSPIAPQTSNDRIAFTTSLAIGYKTPTVFIEPMSAIQTLINDAFVPATQAAQADLANISLAVSFQERRNINEDTSNILQLISVASAARQADVEKLHQYIADQLVNRHQVLAEQLMQQVNKASTENAPLIVPSSLARLAVPLPLTKVVPEVKSRLSGKLVIALGLVLGFVLAIMAAFTAEFVYRVKVSMSEDSESIKSSKGLL